MLGQGPTGGASFPSAAPTVSASLSALPGEGCSASGAGACVVCAGSGAAVCSSPSACPTLISGASAAERSPYISVKRRQAGAAGAGGASAEPNPSDRWSSALPNAEPPHNIRHFLAGCADVTTWVSITHPRCTKVLDGRIAASSKAAWGKSSLRWLAPAIKGQVPDQKAFPSRHGAATNWWVCPPRSTGPRSYHVPRDKCTCASGRCALGCGGHSGRKMSGSGAIRHPMCCGRCLQLRLRRCGSNRRAWPGPSLDQPLAKPS